MFTSRLLNLSSRMPSAATQLRNAALTHPTAPASTPMRLFSTRHYSPFAVSSPMNILRRTSLQKPQKMAFSTSPNTRSKSESNTNSKTDTYSSQFKPAEEMPVSSLGSIMENMNPRVKIFLFTCLTIVATAESYFWCRMIYEKYLRPGKPEENEEDWWETISNSSSKNA